MNVKRNRIREEIEREPWPDCIALDPQSERAQDLARLTFECRMWRALATFLAAALLSLMVYVMTGGK